MNCAVIGIGGTGARCVEALVHLCAMGLGPTELFVVLVDPDASNGNLERARRTILAYNRCRDAITPAREEVIPTFSTRIYFGLNNAPEQLKWSPFGEKMTLGKLFEIASRDQDHANLCRAFYSNYELYDLVWDVGFRGHASVASPAIARVDQHLKEHPWSDLIGETKNALAGGEQRTFVFASAFGATGAGGFPAIPQILRNTAHDEKWNNPNKYGIGGALLLPYMMFTSPTEGVMAKEEHAQARHFLMNTQAALLHYGREWTRRGSPFDSVYYVGAHSLDAIDRDEVKGRFSPGGLSQENPAHFSEVLAAMAALDFFTRERNYESFSGTEHRKRIPKLYALAGGHEAFVDWSDVPDVPAPQRVGTPSRVKKTMLTYLTAQCALVDYYIPLFAKPEFEKNRWSTAWYQRHFGPRVLSDGAANAAFAAMKDFAEKHVFQWFWQWHLTSQQRRVHLFNHDFLRMRVEGTRGLSQDDCVRMFSNILHPSAAQIWDKGEVRDGYTAMFNHMCEAESPPQRTPIGKFWYLLHHAASDYVGRRYKLEQEPKKTEAGHA